MNRLRSPVAVLVVLACASCAGAGHDHPAATAALPVLASSAVPGIPSTTTRLTVTELSKDASIPGLAATIRSFGFQGGRERTFQGESRHLTRVVSRSLLFRDAGGAGRFVGFVRSHDRAYFGVAATVRPLTIGPGRGWLFTPAPCACHLANPDMIGILRHGATVVWLDINGPDATPPLLRTLLAGIDVP